MEEEEEDEEDDEEEEVGFRFIGAGWTLVDPTRRGGRLRRRRRRRKIGRGRSPMGGRSI